MASILYVVSQTTNYEQSPLFNRCHSGYPLAAWLLRLQFRFNYSRLTGNSAYCRIIQSYSRKQIKLVILAFSNNFNKENNDYYLA
jgi:hypothetical protein